MRNEKRDSSRKVIKAILLSVSVLVICCVIAVGVFGKSLQTVNRNANEQTSNMSEEISYLKNRVEKLETTTVKVEEESNTYENTTMFDPEEETTSQTQNSLDDDMKTNKDSNDYVLYWLQWLFTIISIVNKPNWLDYRKGFYG